jgi:hypothetical protein
MTAIHPYCETPLVLSLPKDARQRQPHILNHPDPAPRVSFDRLRMSGVDEIVNTRRSMA